MTILALTILISSFIFSYLVGAIPTGYWFTKFISGKDITKLGSKNIGATNVARVLNNKAYFFVIFFKDFAKTILGLSLVAYTLIKFFDPIVIPNILILNAIIMLVGNSFSIFINFKGGKGVATIFGIILFFFPYTLFFITLGLWIIFLLFFKQAFIASLLSIYLITLVYLLFFYQNYLGIMLLLFLSTWTTLRHKDNIKNFF